MEEKERVLGVVSRSLAWSSSENYLGWNKHDGLNSPILMALFGWSKWPRLIAIQTVMRFPLNLRPLLLIPKVHNPKGLALFVLAWLDQYSRDPRPEYLESAEAILKLLLRIRSRGEWAGSCWGYHYPWQDAGFYAPNNLPNAVVTAFVCEAFLEAYRVTGKHTYLATVESAIQFFLNDLISLKDEPCECCLSYMPIPMTTRVLDVSILIAATIAEYSYMAKNNKNLEIACRLTNYVIKQQTKEGAWFYTDPPEHSHIRHDNYHTGFILDSLWRYMSWTKDKSWENNYWLGLDFYANKLFNSDGSPRWMSHKDFPHDIHGAAQGILTFSRHRDNYSDLTGNIIDWALEFMYHPDGRFFYQQSRLFRKRFTLLRWCNAWMVRALSRWLRDVPS